MLAINYAGKSALDFKGAQSPVWAFPERICFIMPGNAAVDFLCAKCAAKQPISCAVHGPIPNIRFSGGGALFCCEICNKQFENSKKGGKVLSSIQEQKSITRIRTDEQFQVKKLQSIVTSTGGVPFDYEIIQIVFSVGANEGAFANLVRPSADQAFRQADLALKYQCMSLGGDAVIHCIFEHRSALSSSSYLASQVIEVWAYGTAVRRQR